MKDQQPPNGLHKPGHDTPDCAVNMLSHYSFDFAQQIHYPSNPQQPGPIYFKTPHKCTVFGVMALFLLDEAVETGKGANTVISLLDFFLGELWPQRNRVPPPCRQLHRAEQAQCYAAVSVVESDEETPQKDHPLLPCCRPHQVFT